MEFIRYGSLKPQYHEIDVNERNFHTPPVNYGIYAFPKGFSEPFLLGGIGSGNIKNGRWKFVKDENGKKLYVKKKEFYIEEYDDKTYNYLIAEPYKTILAKQKLTHNDVKLYKEDDGVNNGFVDNDEYAYVVVQNKPTRFKYNGLIWHHLDYYGNVWLCTPGDVIKRVGAWVLTDMKTYEKCLKKYLYQKKYERAIMYKGENYVSVTNINGIPLSLIDLDEFEVYIEKI